MAGEEKNHFKTFHFCQASAKLLCVSSYPATQPYTIHHIQLQHNSENFAEKLTLPNRKNYFHFNYKLHIFPLTR